MNTAECPECGLTTCGHIERLPMNLYVVLNSVPDYTARGGPSFKSVHTTFEGAKRALYPDKDYEFSKWPNKDVWEGPDGFGMIKLVEVQP